MGQNYLTCSEIFRRYRHKSLHIFNSVYLGGGCLQREGILCMDVNLCKVEWTQLSSLQYIIYQRNLSSSFAYGISQIMIFSYSTSLVKHSWGFLYMYTENLRRFLRSDFSWSQCFNCNGWVESHAPGRIIHNRRKLQSLLNGHAH